MSEKFQLTNDLFLHILLSREFINEKGLERREYFFKTVSERNRHWL